MQRYLSGDDSVLDELYHQNTGFIRNIAVTVSKNYNCYRQENNHLTDYAGLILEELFSEGMVTFFEILQKKQYDASKGKLTTYLYPFIWDDMKRYMEASLGACWVDQESADNLRAAQQLFHESNDRDRETIEAISEKLNIKKEDAAFYINYNTHFMSVYDLTLDDSDESPYAMFEDTKSSRPDKIVYRKLCVEYLGELFDKLSLKDKMILSQSYGVFGYQKLPLEDIALEQILRVDGVIKARKEAIKKLKKNIDGSKLQRLRIAKSAINKAAKKFSDEARGARETD